MFHPSRIHIVALFFCLLLNVSWSSAQEPTSPPASPTTWTLTPGTTSERTFAADAPHTYEIDLSAGEGLVGLTRGFMYAGAQRIVASLWQVDDLATAELMKRFYRGMLKEKLRPAAALRAAQLEIMSQKRWSSPYFWAGFVIQGEWK